jgi:hypothetical protein
MGTPLAADGCFAIRLGSRSESLAWPSSRPIGAHSLGRLIPAVLRYRFALDAPLIRVLHYGVAAVAIKVGHLVAAPFGQPARSR